MSPKSGELPISEPKIYYIAAIPLQWNISYRVFAAAAAQKALLQSAIRTAAAACFAV
ncbi:MAG TPA: hypothetical protein VGI90_09690 [Steroidobacteraceae bacterium]|jgi:hypothetical protein